MVVARRLNLSRLLAKKSFFLFGPRATGKSTLIAQQLTPQAHVIDLADSNQLLAHTNNPAKLEEDVAYHKRELVVIDEIQLLPQLLNDVQRLITGGKRFLLTGSSTRRLRHGRANLLAGRAWLAHLFPLVSYEISNFNLNRYLHYGGLPAVYFSDEPDEELDAYISVYLQEEIRAEGLVRKLPAFTRFLRVMAISSGEVLNMAKVANDAQVAATTVSGHVEILEDTLLGALLPPWGGSQKRKATRTAKFYFFDTGVTRVLAGLTSIDRNSSAYGKSFEQFIWMELRAYLSYTRKKLSLTYWRSHQGHEVDFLIGEEVAIEVKATRVISKRDFKGLRALADEGCFKKFYLVSHDKLNSRSGQFIAMHWQTFLDQLWSDKLLAKQ
ncbi:MAG: ATP-binding protein [Pseudomonadota bacterium]|nr:ATP-binding protein [Pseudomonadota bacterium]